MKKIDRHRSSFIDDRYKQSHFTSQDYRMNLFTFIFTTIAVDALLFPVNESFHQKDVCF
jgi:hypothetical protein